MIGILTSGGDSPGLNAAIRGIGKTLLGRYDIRVIGFRDGFRGMMENRTQLLDAKALSGILTLGGTILGTSRDKPYAMNVAGKLRDMTGVIVDNYRKHHLDALVCLGGGGTQKNAYHLMKQGLNVITLPKTIDNDVAMTDVSFGYDTALGIATEAIDRLHSTAHSHHRILVLELMGNKAGWLALGAGIAGGADVILIPEIPYDIKKVAAAILRRSHSGQGFSIVAVAEGAVSRQDAAKRDKAGKIKGNNKKEPKGPAQDDSFRPGNSQYLAQHLEKLTGLESRLTILGYLQRGGTPSAGDRLLATRLGTACGELISKGIFGVMVAARGDGCEPVALKDVVGKRRTVPLDHYWIESARDVSTSFGD
jgi:6-phosphofructokinase 1